MKRLAFLGDSIVAGYGVPVGSGFAYQFANPKIIRGFNGATVKRFLLDRTHYSALGEIAAFNPDKLLIWLGTNEWLICRSPAEYYDHLLTLVTNIREIMAINSGIILGHSYPISVTRIPNVCDIPPCNPVSPPPTWQEYGLAMSDAAAAVSALYIDVANTRDWTALLLSDKAHLTQYGHHLLYHDVAKMMGE